MHNSSQHALLFPWGIKNSEGGMASVVQREANLSNSFSVISGDKSAGELQGIQITPCEDAIGPNHPDYDPVLDDHGTLISRRFDTGDWQLEFSDAWTRHCPPEILKEMYDASLIGEEELGSFNHLLAHIEKYGAPYEVNEHWARRFHSPIRSFLAEASGPVTLNFQGSWFAPVINQLASEMRTHQAHTSLHLHGCVPGNMNQSDWGRALLTASSKVDKVFVHTAQFRDDLERQLAEAQLPKVPIDVFRLGIDREWADRGVALVSPSNYQSTIPDFRQLPAEQQLLIDEVFATKASGIRPVPHRFVIAERLGAEKGTHYVLAGISRFLESRQLMGENIGERFRFFFLHEGWQVNEFRQHNVTDQYFKVVREMHSDLKRQIDGNATDSKNNVIWASHSLKGAARIGLPSIVDGCDVIIGGAQEGFGLMAAEGAYINRRNDTALIVGAGAGFSMEAKRLGFGNGALIVQPGDPESISAALTEVVQRREATPGALQRQKSRLISEFILDRNDSIVIKGSDLH